MNTDRLKYRFWEHEDWHDDKSLLKPVYCNIIATARTILEQKDVK